MMKLKVDKSTIEVFGIIATYGVNEIHWSEPLLDYVIQTSLQSFIIKLAKAKMRIRKSLTLQITPSEAFGFEMAITSYNYFLPGRAEYLIALEYFIQPLKKQLANENH